MTRPKAHFLHIGKTGGSAIKAALEARRGDGTYYITLHPHQVILPDVPVGEKAFFVLRHPVTRYVSGFNSRLRKGQPLYDSKWKPQEAEAFSRFLTANELAEALSDTDETRRQHALKAMGSIAHVRDSFWKWFRDHDYLVSRANDLLFVGFQESLESDFQRMLRILGLRDDIVLPTDPRVAHKSPSGFDRTLSTVGERNLIAHYAKDIEFYEEMQRRYSPH